MKISYKINKAAFQVSLDELVKGTGIRERETTATIKGVATVCFASNHIKI